VVKVLHQWLKIWDHLDTRCAIPDDGNSLSGRLKLGIPVG
jgi:hypothetical protein